MPEKVEITAIKIQYPDGDVKHLSLEDARVLYKQLDELFGFRVVREPVYIEETHWKERIWRGKGIGNPPPKLPEVWCCTQDQAGT